MKKVHNEPFTPHPERRPGAFPSKSQRYLLCQTTREAGGRSVGHRGIDRLQVGQARGQVSMVTARFPPSLLWKPFGPSVLGRGWLRGRRQTSGCRSCRAGKAAAQGWAGGNAMNCCGAGACKQLWTIVVIQQPVTRVSLICTSMLLLLTQALLSWASAILTELP